MKSRTISTLIHLGLMSLASATLLRALSRCFNCRKTKDRLGRFTSMWKSESRPFIPNCYGTLSLSARIYILYMGPRGGGELRIYVCKKYATLHNLTKSRSNSCKYRSFYRECQGIIKSARRYVERLFAISIVEGQDAEPVMAKNTPMVSIITMSITMDRA